MGWWVPPTTTLSIVLLDATDGSGLASNYVLPELNALNAPLEVSASTVVVEESITAQLTDLSSGTADAFEGSVEYGVSSEATSVSVETTLLQAPAAGGTDSSPDGVTASDNELGLKIEMVSRPDSFSTGIVAVTIPKARQLRVRAFPSGCPMRFPPSSPTPLPVSRLPSSQVPRSFLDQLQRR